MRLLAVLFAVFYSVSSYAFQPRIGLWANPAESGTGYAIDIQNGTLVLAIYSYQAGGAAQWYLSSGPLEKATHGFTATLDKYENGQCISCAYRPPVLRGNDGQITINFTSEIYATVMLPGRITTIQPFDFGYGPPPGGLLGEWVFVHELDGVMRAERFNFTRTSVDPDSGLVFAVDIPRSMGCTVEQVTDPNPGWVACVDLDGQLNFEQGYEFIYGLDETYQGRWVQPVTEAEYPMKGFRTAGKDGTTRALPTALAERMRVAGAQPAVAADGAQPAPQTAGTGGVLTKSAAVTLARALRRAIEVQ